MVAELGLDWRVCVVRLRQAGHWQREGHILERTNLIQKGFYSALIVGLSKYCLQQGEKVNIDHHLTNNKGNILDKSIKLVIPQVKMLILELPSLPKATEKVLV